MKIILLITVITCLVLGFIPACSDAKPKPPPDEPKYSEGEAIAIVKAKLPELIRNNLIREEPLLETTGIRYLNPITTITVNFMLDGKWDSRYFGDGIWAVFCKYQGLQLNDIFPGDGRIRLSSSYKLLYQSWTVYEFTGMIEER